MVLWLRLKLRSLGPRLSLPQLEMQETRVQSLRQEDSPEEEMAAHLYSCLGNSVDRGAWRATVCGVAKSRTRLSDEHFSLVRMRLGRFCCSCFVEHLWEPQARPAGDEHFPLPLGSIPSVHSAASEPQLSGSVISVQQDIMSVERYPFHLREALTSLNVNLREAEHRSTSHHLK